MVLPMWIMMTPIFMMLFLFLLHFLLLSELILQLYYPNDLSLRLVNPNAYGHFVPLPYDLLVYGYDGWKHEALDEAQFAPSQSHQLPVLHLLRVIIHYPVDILLIFILLRVFRRWIHKLCKKFVMYTLIKQEKGRFLTVKNVLEVIQISQKIVKRVFYF